MSNDTNRGFSSTPQNPQAPDWGNDARPVLNLAALNDAVIVINNPASFPQIPAALQSISAMLGKR
jgi:hypothetical protein